MQYRNAKIPACKQLQIELDTFRQIARLRSYSPFHRNGTTWELLLLLAANDGQSELGVYNTLDQLESRYLGKSALLRFLKDRRADGLLAFDALEKRSSWGLKLNQDLHDKLTELLRDRNRKLAEAFGKHEMGDATEQQSAPPLLRRSR